MNKFPLFLVFFRSFIIQGTWNFERMQNLGFCYAILPFLEKLYSGEALKSAINRHLEFFNTHPYMSAPILGVVARMEEEMEKGGGVSESDIRGVKAGVMGSYGAIGDSFFWGAVKPLTSVFAVCLLLLGIYEAPVFFMVVYNLPHLLMRSLGFWSAYSMGIEFFEAFGRLHLSTLARRIKSAALFLVGVALSLVIVQSGDECREGSCYIFVPVLLFFVFVEVMKKGVSPQKIFYATAFLFIGYSAFSGGAL